MCDSSIQNKSVFILISIEI